MGWWNPTRRSCDNDGPGAKPAAGGRMNVSKLLGAINTALIITESAAWTVGSYFPD
jgi:hypothetical protein